MRSFRLLPIVLSGACLLWAAGCPGNSQTPPAKACSADTDCKSGEERCVAEKCLPVRCGDHPCHAGEGCVNGQCRAADCVEVTCGAAEGCAFGKCLPLACGGKACAAGEVCVKDQCVWTGCAEKTCAVGAVCVDGLLCKGTSCGATACGEGAVCVAEACVAPSCVGIACGQDEACAQGRCVKLSCGGDAGACPTGQACVDGACADPGCAGLTCAQGSRCSAGACLACPVHETACGDGADDDCDGKVDCADPDCDTLDCGAGKACKALACAEEPCGNGKIEGTEECDDGNRVSGDGCSRSCTMECGWQCDGTKVSTCTPTDFFDVSDMVAAAAGGKALRSLALADDGLYVGAEGGKLFFFDKDCAVTDLSGKLSAFWGDAAVTSMAWDSASKVLYLGGSKKGRFAVLHPKGWLGTNAKYPAADTAYDLSAKHALTTDPWTVDAMVFDPTAKNVYLAVNDTTACGPSHLVRYRPEADACDVGLNSCPNPCVAPPNACEVRAMAFDDAGRTLWATGRGKPWTGIHKFLVDAGTFTKCASASLSNNLPRALAYDAQAKSLYVTGTVWDSYGGEFVRWEPEGDAITKLTPKLEGLWGANSSDLNDLWALAVDPKNRSVYVGGRLAKMARYRTPDATDTPDVATLIPLTSTTWLPAGTPTTDAAAVKALAYDPAGFVWIAGENGRLARKVTR